MEKINFLFNADFDEKLFSGNYNQFESSKVNQEFEYLIHWLEPTKNVFTTKIYKQKYLDYLAEQTGESLKTSSQGAPELFCQRFVDVEKLKKIQNKINLFLHLKEKKIIKHYGKRISCIEEVEDGFLYKAPYGMSGGGHYTNIEKRHLIEKALEKYGELLKEEILPRNLDFSTLCEGGKVLFQYENIVDDRFQYKGSYFKPNFKLGGHLDDLYKRTIAEVLDYSREYAGVMSVDGFSYQDHSLIHGACEINTRKTMGYFAFRIWQKYYPSSSFFKFLLFRNKFKAHDLSFFYDQNSLEEVALISPIENNFLIFVVAGNSEQEIKKRELLLYTTLFEG